MPEHEINELFPDSITMRQLTDTVVAHNENMRLRHKGNPRNILSWWYDSDAENDYRAFPKYYTALFLKRGWSKCKTEILKSWDIRRGELTTSIKDDYDTPFHVDGTKKSRE